MNNTEHGTHNSVALASLLRLTSPALPVGAFSYSQGLEYAHEAGWLRNTDEAASWLRGVMSHSLAGLDIPVLARCHRAVQAHDADSFFYWNDLCIAARETRELRLEDSQMGAALLKLLRDTEDSLPFTALQQDTLRISWPAAFALTSKLWGIALRDACTGFVWSWLENQLAAAAKIIPLGQTSVQRTLAQLSLHIDSCVTRGLHTDDDDIGSSLPGLALASMLHETQYTRLFRS